MKYQLAIVCFLSAFLFLLQFPTFAAMMFDVTFEDPPHILGTYTATGAPPLYPSSGSAFVATVPGFTSQVGLVSGYLTFQPTISLTSGIHVLSWDFMNLSVSTYGSGPGAALFINNNPPGYDFYLSHGVIEGVILDVQGTWVYTGAYSISILASYAFTIDLDSRVYGFSIDGTNVLYDMPLPATMASLRNVSFEKPGNNSYAIDNFRWEVVIPPEMTDILTAIEIGYATQTGLTYQAQYADVVTTTNWFDLGAPFVGDGSTNYVLHTTRDATNRIYRVILLP